MGKFTNKTVDGAKRLFALLVVLILLFSFLAHMFATNFGRVKIEQINIDARGALQLELCFCAGSDAPAYHLFIKKAL